MTPIPRRAGAVYDPYTDDMYPDEQRPPSSAIRWDRDTQGNQIIQRGRQRLVIHNAPPPKKRSIWLPLCLGMLLMVLMYLGGSWALNWWSLHQLDAHTASHAPTRPAPLCILVTPPATPAITCS